MIAIMITVAIMKNHTSKNNDTNDNNDRGPTELVLVIPTHILRYGSRGHWAVGEQPRQHPRHRNSQENQGRGLWALIGGKGYVQGSFTALKASSKGFF